MKRLFLLLAALVSMLLTVSALADAAVTLPTDYETSGRRYPVAYILPQDGYAQDDSGIAELLVQAMEEGMCTDMILVRPAFAADADVRAQLAEITAQVDAQYRTVPAASHRALIGTGAGGSLAYALGLTDDSGRALTAPERYGMLFSIRGDFAGNPWNVSLGSVYDLIEEIHITDADAISRWYTYMDAPVDDAYSDMQGSTNDLGALFIGYGTGSVAHEYTARPGAYDAAFLAESISRIAQRMTDRLLAGAAVGSIALHRTTLTEADAFAAADCSVTLTDAFAAFCPDGAEAEICVSAIDPKSGALLSGASITRSVTGAGTQEVTLEFPNAVTGASADVVLSVRLLGAELDLAKATLIRSQPPVIDGEYQHISLLGDWHFNYTGAGKTLDPAALTQEAYGAWPVVQPTLGNWTKGYGNISDENVFSGYGPDYFDYFITGSGYYAKQFTVPKDFDAQELVLSVGYVDDRCEVFLNGVRVGATGMDENGNPTGETTWSVWSVFDVDPTLLLRGGENTIVVRAWNDQPFGAGGWYGGPVGLYSRAAFEREYDSAADERFYEETFPSAHAAAAQGKKGTVDNEYLIYLPEGYESSDRAYPTVYLLHQFNSDHTSYRGDRVNELLDAGAAQGLFDEMIVVIPNSSEESWWAGEWEKMITEELIPLIDSRYRTIRDARYRLTAGCSMGGQGAMAVALRNPDDFSGAVSFFGAFSYGGAASPNAIAASESAEYMDAFALYFICGNQDSYGFGVPAIDLHQQLGQMGVKHGFLIDNGGHDSGFYVPFFDDAFAYVRADMYRHDGLAPSCIGADMRVEGGRLIADVVFDEAIKAYFHRIPASSYTENAEPELPVDLFIEITQDGVTTKSDIFRGSVAADAAGMTVEFPLEGLLDTGRDYTVTLKSRVLDGTAEHVTLSMDAQE